MPRNFKELQAKMMPADRTQVEKRVLRTLKLMALRELAAKK
jgi:hypothetical protein